MILITPLQFQADIQASLDGLVDGETIQIGPGTYDLNPAEPLESNPAYGGGPCPTAGAALVVRGKHNVKILGAGDPLLRTTRHGTALCFIDCSGVEMSGIRWRGNGYYGLVPTENLPYYFAATDLAGVNDRLWLHRMSYTQFGNHGIAHLHGGRTDNSLVEDIEFIVGGHLNRVDCGGADGAACAVNGEGNTIRNLSIYSWVRGIEFEAKTPRDMRGLIVRDCRIEQCRWHAIIVTPTNQNADWFSDNVIENCIIRGRGEPWGKFKNEHGILIQGGRNFRISGCSISNLYDWTGIHLGEQFCDITDWQITNNRIYGPVMRTGIHVERTGTSTIARGIIDANQVGPVGGRGMWVDADDVIVSPTNQVWQCGTATVPYEKYYVAPGCQRVVVPEAAQPK